MICMCCLQCLLCHTKASGSVGFISTCLLCFLLASDGTVLWALRKNGFIFCPIDFLLLHLTNTGSASSLNLPPPNQLRPHRKTVPEIPAEKLLQDLRLTHPQCLGWGRGQCRAAMDAKSLSWSVHPPDRAGKWSNWTSSVSEGWGNSTARRIWQEICELARQHRTEIRLRNGNALPWAGLLWTRSSFRRHLASLPVLASASLRVSFSDSGTEEQSNYSSTKLFNASLIDLYIHGSKSPSRPESGSKNSSKICTFWELPPNPELWAGWPWKDVPGTANRLRFSVSPLKGDPSPQNHILILMSAGWLHSRRMWQVPHLMLSASSLLQTHLPAVQCVSGLNDNGSITSFPQVSAGNAAEHQARVPCALYIVCIGLPGFLVKWRANGYLGSVLRESFSQLLLFNRKLPLQKTGLKSLLIPKKVH